MIVHGIGQPEGQTNIIFGVVVIALFVVINPLMIYVKTKKQAIENPVYKNPTYYTLRDDGIFCRARRRKHVRRLSGTEFIRSHILWG